MAASRGRVQVPVPDFITGVKALREGRVNACFGGHVSSGVVLDLDAAIGVHPLPFGITPKDIKIHSKFLPGASPHLIKAGTGIVKKDTWCEKFRINLVAYGGLSVDAAYEAFKAIWNNYENLQRVHVYLANWNHEAFVDPEPGAPYHPGTIKFYKEKGLWTKELEQKQKRLMEQAK